MGADIEKGGARKTRAKSTHSDTRAGGKVEFRARLMRLRAEACSSGLRAFQHVCLLSSLPSLSFARLTQREKAELVRFPPEIRKMTMRDLLGSKHTAIDADVGQSEAKDARPFTESGNGVNPTLSMETTPDVATPTSREEVIAAIKRLEARLAEIKE